MSMITDSMKVKGTEQTISEELAGLDKRTELKVTGGIFIWSPLDNCYKVTLTLETRKEAQS